MNLDFLLKSKSLTYRTRQSQSTWHQTFVHITTTVDKIALSTNARTLFLRADSTKVYLSFAKLVVCLQPSIDHGQCPATTLIAFRRVAAASAVHMARRLGSCQYLLINGVSEGHFQTRKILDAPSGRPKVEKA